MVEWDEAKNKTNVRRHKLSFETAGLVFGDPFAITVEDYIDDNGEMRYQTLGLVEGVLINVGHVFRVIEGEEQPWIITARKAVKYEEKIYSAHRKSKA